MPGADERRFRRSRRWPRRLAFLFIALASTTADAQAYSPCRTIDAAALDDRAMISEIVTGTDTLSARRRSGWDLPVVADSAISFVVDSTVCAAAAVAHAQATQDTTNPPPPVHVLRVGHSRYVVFNYTPVGEYFAYVVFDPSWACLRSMIG